MSELSLNEGQEFYAGGKRFIIRGGAPVQEAKRGPLGGELVRFDNLLNGKRFVLMFEKISDQIAKCVTPGFNSAFNNDDIGILGKDMVEIIVPQQSKGRVMTAGEAARLPDIVGKRVCNTVDLVDLENEYCIGLSSDGGADWLHESDVVEVLD